MTNRTEAREALAEILDGATKATARRIGEIDIIIGSPEFVAVESAKRLRQGWKVTQDGVTTWRETAVIFDAAKSGSAAYVWDKSNNRVKHERIVVTQVGDNAPTREVVGTIFKSF